MRRTALAIVVVAGAAAGPALFLPDRNAAADQSPRERAALAQAQDLSAAFQRATRLIAPSVVYITATQRVEVVGRRRDRGEDSGPHVFRGQGSGVIVRHDGYIITNYHVVENSSEVQVTLANGRRYPAEIVGTDEETDLAVIRIDASGLPPARFGDSDTCEVGQ